ncbi:MAG: cellulase family glycosylhydrolase [Clostridiales bacterium]|jgi:endoglycosylceramidase|nr:cellulase family glycosylhydrolase [Clostridiales bacterium]
MKPIPNQPLIAKDIRVDGTRLVDPNGKQVHFRGINLINKGIKRPDGAWDFDPTWPDAVWQRFADLGMNAVRLGIIWAALEPVPGQYDERYINLIKHQLDLAAQAGMSVMLDMHQDLYAQRFSDGAPDWAVLTDAPYEATDLWSDAYLSSPAVQQAWDAFWENKEVPQTGRGLQDHYAALWAHLAAAFHDHPALFSYDIMNEPAPGSQILEMFGLLMHNVAESLTPEEATHLGLSEPSLESLSAAFSDPESKLKLLSLLDDPERYRLLGDLSQEPVIHFERTVLEPFYEKITTAILAHDEDRFILRGNNYISNIGVPSGIRPITVKGRPDPKQIFAPHGYDLVVDTPAMLHPSDSRAQSIFRRHRETQLALNLPAIVTEWGAFDIYDSALNHGRFLLDLFASWGWGNTYWCYTENFFEVPVRELLENQKNR